MFFISSSVKRTLAKVLLQQRHLPLKINISLYGCELWASKKKYVTKRLLKMFLTEDEKRDKNQYEIF